MAEPSMRDPFEVGFEAGFERGKEQALGTIQLSKKVALELKEAQNRNAEFAREVAHLRARAGVAEHRYRMLIEEARAKFQEEPEDFMRRVMGLLVHLEDLPDR
jgi:hypothetical protein